MINLVSVSYFSLDAVNDKALFRQTWYNTQLKRHNRDFLQTEIRKLRRKRGAAGWEVRNKMAHFRENLSERSAGGPWNQTKFSVRFRLAGSSLPMWPSALAVWDCTTPHQLLPFCLFFSYVVIFEIVELYSVDFVFSSMFSSSEPQAFKFPRNQRSLPRTVPWESLKKCVNILFVESRGWRGEGKRRRKTTSRVINVKVVFLLLCPLPIHPSLSTLPRVKQFCCYLVDHQY